VSPRPRLSHASSNQRRPARPRPWIDEDGSANSSRPGVNSGATFTETTRRNQQQPSTTTETTAPARLKVPVASQLRACSSANSDEKGQLWQMWAERWTVAIRWWTLPVCCFSGWEGTQPALCHGTTRPGRGLDPAPGSAPMLTDLIWPSASARGLQAPSPWSVPATGRRGLAVTWPPQPRRSSICGYIPSVNSSRINSRAITSSRG
jgi:hypothetical protein